MKITKALQGKILQHADGMGVPTAELVRKRAAEIARIDGRSSFNDQDWRQAKLELHGGHASLDGNGDDEMAEFVSERDMVAGSTGHHTENTGIDDLHSVVEELVFEGMDEAVHDQMLQASQLDDGEREI